MAHLKGKRLDALSYPAGLCRVNCGGGRRRRFVPIARIGRMGFGLRPGPVTGS